MKLFHLQNIFTRHLQYRKIGGFSQSHNLGSEKHLKLGSEKHLKYTEKTEFALNIG